MRLARGHNVSLDPQLLGLKSSTLPPSHFAPFCCLKKMQCSFINTVNVVFCFFFTANYVDPASSGSSFEACHKIAAINVAFLHG